MILIYRLSLILILKTSYLSFSSFLLLSRLLWREAGGEWYPESLLLLFVLRIWSLIVPCEPSTCPAGTAVQTCTSCTRTSTASSLTAVCTTSFTQRYKKQYNKCHDSFSSVSCLSASTIISNYHTERWIRNKKKKCSEELLALSKVIVITNGRINEGTKLSVEVA